MTLAGYIPWHIFLSETENFNAVPYNNVCVSPKIISKFAISGRNNYGIWWQFSACILLLEHQERKNSKYVICNFPFGLISPSSSL